MKLYLVKPDLIYFEQYCEMYEEWKAEEHINPWFLRTECETLESFADFIQTLDSFENGMEDKKYASQTAYFAVDEKNNLIGAASLRHYLTVDGYHFGGHIGYGVRPSERRKGYATQILHLTLREAEKLKIRKVLLTALETNTGSNRVIQKCGGIFENKIQDADGDIINRYWITANEL